MTPPKVEGTAKPASSVMISRTLGAPSGGVMRGGHQGFDCRAPSLMTPPNSGSGGGSCLPLMVEVALGEPRVPVTCCAVAWLMIASEPAKSGVSWSGIGEQNCLSPAYFVSLDHLFQVKF
jgi:hypothetical protein